MKKIFYSILTVAAALSVASCMEPDNWDEPEASIRGRVINSVTGDNILTDQGDLHIRIWEMSFSLNPEQQELKVAADGSYTNLRLFNGTYDMVPNDGSWWPADTVRDVAIGKKNHATQDFIVTPYLMLKNFKVQLLPNNSGKVDALDTLRMSCNLFCPQPQRMAKDEFGNDVMEVVPSVRQIRAFLNINKFCGASNSIGYYGNENQDDEKNELRNELNKGPENTKYYTFRKQLMSPWSLIGDMETGVSTIEYVLRVPVKRGYQYSVRMGANVDDQYQKFNYTPIIVVKIPETIDEMQEFTAREEYPKYYD